MSLKSSLKKVYHKINYNFLISKFDRSLLDVRKKHTGEIALFGAPFYYHHGNAFYDTYKEIFIDKIYNFKTNSETPLIIDCGANMGLSLLYFNQLYPNSNILAFEPDTSVLPFLEKNLQSQVLHNVKLYKNAVWNANEELTFFTDNGMGGRVRASYNGKDSTTINALRLKDFLNEPVDMLKIDIEGAEYTVLNDCNGRLQNVKHLFVEYHSDINGEQHLDDILSILKANGFRYHLKESFSRKNPFVSKHILCEKFDLAINVFAYKN
ncbi:FkbM family methyltransferase [Winogradskyella forsetii]|uniref:FkbM family methyltransferase n=1 Tax=Winogradskyella forsetii TaxID=2686077 RepID=UPI0015C1AD84|nr:FkbM family methyltransferase [Winogradskyella forsetii]